MSTTDDVAKFLGSIPLKVPFILIDDETTQEQSAEMKQEAKKDGVGYLMVILEEDMISLRYRR